MLQENASDPEPGNEIAPPSDVPNSVVAAVDNDERYSHYYTLACMLTLLNSDGDGNDEHFNFLSNDKLID